ncbi:serine protease [Pontiellaceae bacterium B1224]|nr:serine protease [Pontiellaceae bacterium B1224]
MKKKDGGAAVYTYSPAGYLVNYRYVDKSNNLKSGSITKRDAQNRSEEYTRVGKRGKPLYTYWFRWKEDGLIDRERQQYHQEDGERLHIYEYLKTDMFGNWTQRLMARYDIGGKERVKVYERLVVRDITYHNDTHSEIVAIDASATTNIPYALGEEPQEDPSEGLTTMSEQFEKNLDDIKNPKKPELTSVAELLKTGRTQEELKTEFNYTFNDISDKLIIITCKSDRGRSSGSGFIAKMDGKTYLFTNQHVIMGADSIRLKTAEGETIIPAGTIELSIKRDIARIALKEREAFEITSKFSLGSPLGVFGNSEGAGVATELFGEVTGLGTDLVEVNAEFVSGNSGSPVLDVRKNVIGIASFVRVTWEPPKNDDNEDSSSESDEDSEEEGDFESKTRRFCYRLDDLEWQPVKWKEYNKKYGKLYRNSEALAESVFDIINVWSGSPLKSIPENDDMARDLATWVKKHNDIIARYERRKYTQNSFLNAYSGSLEILSKTCHDRSRRIAMFSKQRELSGFLRSGFENNAYSLDYAGYYIQAIADDIANQ